MGRRKNKALLRLHLLDPDDGRRAVCSDKVDYALGIAAALSTADFREYDGSCDICSDIPFESETATVTAVVERSSLDGHAVLQPLARAYDNLLSARAFWLFGKPGREQMDAAYNLVLEAAQDVILADVVSMKE